VVETDPKEPRLDVGHVFGRRVVAAMAILGVAKVGKVSESGLVALRVVVLVVPGVEMAGTGANADSV
jgi:hypothetical protein